MKRILIFVLVLLVSSVCFSQETTINANALRQEEPKVEEQIKTWVIPVELMVTLKGMIDEFNKRYTDMVAIYTAGLIATKAEFKDLPDDVILYLDGGVFIKRDDFLKLQAAQKELIPSVKEESKK